MSDRPNLSKGPAGAPAAPTDKSAPPRIVLIAVALLAFSGIAAVIASATLYTSSVKTWIRDSQRNTISDTMKDKVADVKKGKGTASEADITALQNLITQVKATPSDRLTPVANQIKDLVKTLKAGTTKKGDDALGSIDDQADNALKVNDAIAKTQKGTLISSIVVLIALGIAARAAYRGRYWARWAVLGLWVLATFTGTAAGIGYILSVGSDIPAAFKVPAFLAALALVVAVFLTNLKPSSAFFNLTRPERGARPQRRGLFAPPAPRETAPPEPARTSNPDRSRGKQRTSDAAVAKGADLARSRAKASKSRRTGG